MDVECCGVCELVFDGMCGLFVVFVVDFVVGLGVVD